MHKDYFKKFPLDFLKNIRADVSLLAFLKAHYNIEIVNEVYSYFINENEHGKAQIIFSSHSLGFMNKLDMHQMYLVEKNNSSESLAYRLNEIKDIRSDDNFLSKYMTGAYGAFPKIRV